MGESSASFKDQPASRDPLHIHAEVRGQSARPEPTKVGIGKRLDGGEPVSGALNHSALDGDGGNFDDRLRFWLRSDAHES